MRHSLLKLKKGSRGQTSMEFAVMMIVLLAIVTSISPILKSAFETPVNNARDKVVSGPANPPAMGGVDEDDDTGGGIGGRPIYCGMPPLQPCP
jgi:hypothetical protein